ncbi:MAG: LuxR C-terminal-related transcriptional regulator [Nakamurella sp.]
MPERRSAPLIAVKQTIPPVRTGAVPRPRLQGRLLASSSRLTVVVAPAGWGKTTLLSQWAHDAAETRGIVWLSLDETDDDPIRFWTYVLTALQRGIPGLTEGLPAALSTPGLDPVELAIPALLNELSDLAGAHLLVLDDYHVLSHPGIHESVEFFLGYLPPALRMVIAGRSDPPLPLARLRARGELTEIRAAELSFDLAETGELLGAAGPVVPSTTMLLWQRTEGWAAALHLAAMALRDEQGTDSAFPAISSEQHILDYLTTEVVDRLRPDQRDLLLRTSVLERLSGSLCDSVLGRHGSAAVLRELDRADLLVVPLDPAGEWFRCHRLFRQVLRHQLSIADESAGARVLTAAADWYLARGHINEAIEHRILAGDPAGAADLLRAAVPHFLQQGALTEHLRLADRLPPTAVVGDPGLCLSLAWAAGLSGRFDRMTPWLDAADSLITDDSPALAGWRSLRGAAATLRAVEVSIGHADTAAALDSARLAVQLETDPAVPGYVMARTVIGAMLSFDDQCEEAIPYLMQAWDRARTQGLPALLGLQAASILAMALFETGRFDRLRRLFADVASDIVAAEALWDSATAPGIARLRTIEGRLAHGSGDFAAARGLLLHAVTLARTFGEAPGLVAALTGLAELELDDHHRGAAHTALAEAREVVANDPVLPLFVRRLEAVEHRAGRRAAAQARRSGILVEDLTEREQSILRALTTDATQREIGANLYLSINTVKGYTKVLYRKLGVATREDAVRQARACGLI